MCLENILRYFAINNMKKAKLNGYVHNFPVAYDVIDHSNVINIHEYWIKNIIFNFFGLF